MESELFRDITFFNGIINDTQLVTSDENARKLVAKKPKTTRKSNPTCGTRRSSKSPQKENIIPEESKPVKKRMSKKSEREPLKPLNKEKSPVKKNANSTTKKPAVSPSKRTKTAKPAEAKRKNPTVPKIVIYKDPNDKESAKEKKTRRYLSKSWDGSDPKMRQSFQETIKSPKSKIERRSLNDLTNLKSPNKKITPEKRRVTRLKPGQPEFEEMFGKLETLFPNADPEFLKAQFIKFKASVSDTIEYIILKEKTNELPSKDEYIRRIETERLQNKFWENFSVENFLKLIPDPWEHFLKTQKQNSDKYLPHSIHYLKNKYKKHYANTIQSALSKNGNSLYLANKELKKKKQTVKMRVTNRSKTECDAGKPTTFNIHFVYEVAFMENESKIKAHIKKREAVRYKKFKEAKEAGTLLECQSCNDFSLLPDDAVNCPANHVFCKDCVVKFVEIEIEKSNFQFKCLLKCEKRFSMESLQAVLSPLVTAEIIKRNQLEEIKAAGMKDLVFCPFCCYVAILPQELNIFKCLNPSCLVESCRVCKQPNHVPLKCNEFEKFDKSVLEVRNEEEDEKEDEEEEEEEIFCLTCSSCNGEFLKREDSNEMVCPCGATICSICQQPFPECSHFQLRPHRHTLSSSSDDTVYEAPPEDTSRRNSDSEIPQDFMDFLPSESDNS